MIRSLPRTGSLLLVLASIGCGSEVLVIGPPGDPDPGPGTGAGGSVPPSPTTSVGGNVPPDPPPPACTTTDDRFQMAFYANDGSLWGCDAGVKSDEGAAVVDGVVIASDAVSILVDSCPPAGPPCPPEPLSLLEFDAPGLIHSTPVGAFVRIAVAVDAPMGCAHELVVRNLPTWVGVPNPVDTTERIWLAGADGTLGLGAFDSVGANLVEASCDPSSLTDVRDLELDWGVGSAPLAMGEELIGDQIAMRNLRSFAPSLDTHEVGYWFAQP